MEADFNFNKDILTRDLIQCAEIGVNVSKEKYGSRKGGKSIMHVVNKRLIYDVIHLQRNPAILCINYAK